MRRYLPWVWCALWVLTLTGWMADRRWGYGSSSEQKTNPALSSIDFSRSIQVRTLDDSKPIRYYHPYAVAIGGKSVRYSDKPADDGQAVIFIFDGGRFQISTAESVGQGRQE